MVMPVTRIWNATIMPTAHSFSEGNNLANQTLNEEIPEAIFFHSSPQFSGD
jgi:hypothetical protein